MSLAIITKVPEGIVLAAESRVSYDIPYGDNGSRLVTFDNATKVLEMDGYNRFGAVTFGVANIGDRTAHSFLPEFIAHLKKDKQKKNLTVEQFSKELSNFFSAKWKEAMADDFPSGENMHFVVSGFDKDNPYAKVYQFAIPETPKPTPVSGMEGFNIIWGGQTDIVERIFKGFDASVLNWVDQNIELTDEQSDGLVKAIQDSQLPVVCGALALQDAINLCITLIRTTIDIQSLAAGIRGVGGPIDVAIITKDDGFKFIQRKALKGEN